MGSEHLACRLIEGTKGAAPVGKQWIVSASHALALVAKSTVGAMNGGIGDSPAFVNPEVFVSSELAIVDHDGGLDIQATVRKT